MVRSGSEALDPGYTVLKVRGEKPANIRYRMTEYKMMHETTTSIFMSCGVWLIIGTLVGGLPYTGHLRDVFSCFETIQVFSTH
jgi:hypothetical protein